MRVLRVWNVDLRAALAGKRAGLRVPDYPDNFAHEFFIAAMPSKCRPDAEAFADRGCGRTEMTLRGGFVDDYHLRSVSIVARFEGASGKQRNLQGAKIIARDGGEHRVLRFVHRERPAFRNKPASNRITIRVERKIDAASRGLHARHHFQPFYQLPEKFRALLIIFVFRTLQRQVGDKDVVRIEAGPNLLKTEEALDEQSSAHQQHEREGDLTNQQEAARAG